MRSRPRAFMPSRISYCCYCKRGPLIQGGRGDRGVSLTATRDHFVPSNDDNASRWVPCCLHCNQLKGALRPTPWLAFIDHNPGYWRAFQRHAQVLQWLIDYNRYRRSQGWRSLSLYTTAPDNIMALANRA